MWKDSVEDIKSYSLLGAERRGVSGIQSQDGCPSFHRPRDAGGGVVGPARHPRRSGPEPRHGPLRVRRGDGVRQEVGEDGSEGALRPSEGGALRPCLEACNYTCPYNNAREPVNLALLVSAASRDLAVFRNRGLAACNTLAGCTGEAPLKSLKSSAIVLRPGLKNLRSTLHGCSERRRSS